MNAPVKLSGTAVTAAEARSQSPSMSIEVRFGAGLIQSMNDGRRSERIEAPAETTVGDLIARYRLSLTNLSKVLCNGRDMNPGTYTGGNIDLGASISDGDVITFIGQAPVVPGTRSAAV